MSEKLVLPKSQSPQMFDEISSRYDLLNRLLSFGQDLPWRRRLKEFLPASERMQVLDLMSGTADVLIVLSKDNPRIVRGIGVDLAANMLAIGQKKIEAAGLGDKLFLQVGDAQALPFLNESFDCVTASFGMRNLPDLRLGLLQSYRVLRQGGRLLILEFSKPQNPVLFAGHWLYLKTGVPLIGFLFSGNWKAYRYLNQTIAGFPYGEQFCKILKQFGFTNVHAHPLMGGVATIYVAEK